ncbi:MAG: hypothetical protein IK132_04535 [Clostridia bacterium]|jgi:hypothetical protein|nr:hypothetical protein [Clostridia bacterium]
MPKKEKKLTLKEEPKKELKAEDLEKVAGGTDPTPDPQPEEPKPEKKKSGDITLPEIP